MPDSTNISPTAAALQSTRPLSSDEFVRNPDGSWSNEKTVTVQQPDLNFGFPTVVPSLWLLGGVPTTVSEDLAAQLAANSKLDFPWFGSVGGAEKFANNREANWQNIEPGTKNVPPLWTTGVANPTSASAVGVGFGQDPRFLSALESVPSRIVSHWANNLWNFLSLPSRLPKDATLEDLNEIALPYALSLASLSTPVGAATVPENTLGTFMGKLSKTWDPRAAAHARLLERPSGLLPSASADDIFNATGTFRGPEGMQRQVISDAPAELKLSGFQQNPYNPELYGLPLFESQKLPDILSHPDLFAAYPSLGNTTIKPMGFGGIGTAGAYFPKADTIFLSGARPENLLSTLLHETTHAIQSREGFARGGSTQEFLPEGFGDYYKGLEKEYDSFLNKINSLGLSEKDRDAVIRYTDLVRYGIKPARSAVSGWENAPVPTELRQLFGDLGNKLNNAESLRDIARQNYKNLSGEVEARLVQEQLGLRDWSRPPWRYEGYIPYSQQIVKPNDIDVPIQLIPVDHDPFVER